MATLDHELKFSRALKHLQDLDGEIRRWLDGHHYTVRYEFDLQARFGGLNKPDPASRFSMFSGTVSFDGKSIPTPPGVEFGHGLLTAFATAEQPPRDPISLLIGDTLHNLRSGLDNLAHALALAGPGPLSKEFPGSSEFPIFGDENRKGVAGSGPGLFQNNGLFKIQGWHPDAKAAVELLQPYHRGNDYRSDPLWTLHELDNISKHRLLHPAVAAFESTRWRPSGFTNVLVGPGIMEFPRGAIQADTPIARVFGVRPIDPAAEMHVEIHPALDVAFTGSAPSALGKPVVATLANIYTHVIEKVVPELVRYL